MKFRIGRYYEHENGSIMRIIIGAETKTWGRCLLAETFHGEIKPISEEPGSSANWVEISESEWLKGRKKKGQNGKRD